MSNLEDRMGAGNGSATQTHGVEEAFFLDEDARRRGVIEALLTASDDALPLGRLVELTGDGASAKEIRDAIDELNEAYVKGGRSFRIAEVASGYQLTVHQEFAPYIRRLLQERPVRLSQAALETLSIVAFKQPITKAEVEHIRGVASDGVLRHLIEKGLVRIAGRSDGVGRPILYGTARDFLKFFGLRTLSDLPEIKDVEELLEEEEERSEAAAPVGAGQSAGATEDEPRGDAAPEAKEEEDHNEDRDAGTTEPVSGEIWGRVEEDV